MVVVEDFVSKAVSFDETRCGNCPDDGVLPRYGNSADGAEIQG